MIDREGERGFSAWSPGTWDFYPLRFSVLLTTRKGGEYGELGTEGGLLGAAGRGANPCLRVLPTSAAA